jgi:hypothetical protein
MLYERFIVRIRCRLPLGLQYVVSAAASSFLPVGCCRSMLLIFIETHGPLIELARGHLLSQIFRDNALLNNFLANNLATFFTHDQGLGNFARGGTVEGFGGRFFLIIELVEIVKSFQYISLKVLKFTWGKIITAFLIQEVIASASAVTAGFVTVFGL